MEHKTGSEYVIDIGTLSGYSWFNMEPGTLQRGDCCGILF